MHACRYGFTLIELSIVLVITGLIAGGIFLAKELIQIATIHGQVKQIQQVLLATQVFKEKYRYLPGDIPADKAIAFGLIPRSTGMLDTGNGIIRGYYGLGATISSAQSGEPVVFWSDLGDANLLPKLPYATADRVGNTYTYVDGSTNPFKISDILPLAKSGNGGVLSIWSGGYSLRWNDQNHNGKNYLGIAAITEIWGGTDTPVTYMSMTPFTAFQIDTKIDNGLPQSGKMLAMYIDGAIHGGEPMVAWAHGGRVAGGGSCLSWWCHGLDSNSPTKEAIAADEDTCYDNGNVNGNDAYYSVGTNSQNLNCALSIEIAP